MPVLRDASISAGIALGLLLASEGLARASYTFTVDTRRFRPPDLTVPDREIGWRLKPDRSGTIEYGIAGYPRTFDANGHLDVDSAQVADSSRYKVVTLGDSTTYGYGVRVEDSFAELLDARIEADVVNLGVVGYSSFQARVAFERYLSAHRVDFVIIGTSFNDRRYVPPGEHVDSRARFDHAARFDARSPAVLEHSYLFRGIRAVAQSIGLVPSPLPPPPRAPVGDLRPRVNEEAFADNLNAIATLARARQIPIVFLALIDNPAYTLPLEAALSLPPADRLAHLAYLVGTMTSHAPLARQALVAEARAQGDNDLAEREQWTAVRTSTTGGDLVRWSSTYADIIRRVATQRDIPVVAGPSSPDMYLDFYHPNEGGHRLLADRLQPYLSGLN